MWNRGTGPGSDNGSGRKAVGVAVIVISAIIVIGFLVSQMGGCMSIADAQKAQQRNVERVESVSSVVEQAAEIIERVQQGAIDAEQAIDLLTTMLPARWPPTIESIRERGADAAQALGEVSAALLIELEQARMDLEASTARLAEAETDRQATLMFWSDLVGVAAGAVAGGGLVTPIAGLIGLIFGRNKGQREVMRVVETGKAKGLREQFDDDDSPAVVAMRKVAESTPGFSRNLKAVKDERARLGAG